LAWLELRSRKRNMNSFSRTGGAFIAVVFLFDLGLSQGAVTLDAAGLYLTKHGYGGSQLIHPSNFYVLPIQSNNKPGNLLVDTGAPHTLIFRSSLRRLDLIETKTKLPVKGAFGAGRDSLGLTTIKAFTTGNCTLTNVPVAVAPGGADTNLSRTNSNGLFGLRELIRFGAVLDLPSRLVYLRPSRPGGDVGATIKSILLHEGYTSVPLSIANFHLRINGQVNGVPCSLLVDTGAYLTLLDQNFASRAKIRVTSTPLVAQGIGGSSALGMGTLASLRMGNYEIRNASATIAHLGPDVLARSGSVDVAGFVGVEYLATNSAIFDFVTGTMYLRPRSR
jgi:predicted aspartyl protease